MRQFDDQKSNLAKPRFRVGAGPLILASALARREPGIVYDGKAFKRFPFAAAARLSPG